MSTKIQVKRSTTSGVTPNTTNAANTTYIDAGELAINLPDGRMFSSNGSVLIEVGANLTSLNVVGGTTVNGALTINNTAATGNTTVTGFANISATLAAGNTTITGFANVTSSLQISSLFLANSTVVKITSNDKLTFNDDTTQNTAFRVYDSSGTRIA